MKTETRQILYLMFLATAILWQQIQNVVLYSVDGIVYALVGKELTLKPLTEWVVLTWNQHPFYEHPHLTPWILGLCMKIFGVSTTTAIIPIVLISTLTVLLTYFLGRQLIDHHYGLLAATILSLTPQFIKSGRNPMLEPALMFFITLTIYFHIKHTKTRSTVYTFLTGICLALAFLAKGPPALLALAVIVTFQGLTFISPKIFSHFRCSLIHILASITISTTLICLVDVWHMQVAGTSFFKNYFIHQLKFTILDGRGQTTNDVLFYIKIFLSTWPWLPFVLLSIPLMKWKKDTVSMPALSLGALIVLGTLLGFTLIKHKSSWYIDIYYVGLSLMATITLRHLLPQNTIDKHYAKFCTTITIPLLFLSSTFPSLFLSYPRPLETFLIKASQELGSNLEGKMIGDCVHLDPWRGPFLLKFYLGTTKTDCHTAKLNLIDNRSHVLDHNSRVVFSQQPFSIIEQVPD